MNGASLFEDESSSALIDPTGTYRYRLVRRWGLGPSLVWVMLNPSTADASIDDPTIRRVKGFTVGLGFDSFVVVNLFALRATDPTELAKHPDPVGPDNDSHIRQECNTAPMTIAAWGAHRMAARRAAQVRPLLRHAHCLGTSRDGSPRHPLYLSKSAPLMPWPVTS